MSSALERTVPTRAPGPPHDAGTTRPPSDGRDHDRVLAEDWTSRIDHMHPDDLRLLAVSLPLIEQAKGILMGHYGCDATTAFAILRRWSSLQDRKLRDVAGALVTEASRDGGRADGQPSDAVGRFLRAQGLG
jgi:hypothetical protein